MKPTITWTLALALSIAVAACGGPPNNNPLLDEARTAVAAASSDPAIASGAPDALNKAEANLRRGERLLEEGADADEVYHYAYLAKQHAAIAEETARVKAAEEEIKRAELERQQVVLQAREREAARAKLEAEQERLKAEQERQKAAEERQAAQTERERAEAALERARELDRRVKELEAQQTERGLVLTLGEVLFDVGRSTLKEGGRRAVDRLASFLREYPERKVLIEGHTDNTGSQQLNLDLSRRRAEAVKAALMDMGIPESRIRTVGHGPAYPVAGNTTAAGRQQNRRVEVVISDQTGVIRER